MTGEFRAGHLPGFAIGAGTEDRDGEVQWQTLRFEAHGRALQVSAPLLTDAQAGTVARHVRAHAREVLQRMRVDEIIGVIDRAVARLLDPSDPHRRTLDEWLPVVTGFDAEMLRLGLTASLQAFRAPQLRRFVAQDFANPQVLDGFQPAVKGGAVRAFGPGLLVHHWAGNVPGLPLWSLACGLLVKAGSVGKLPSAEPVFATVFARLLAEVHPPLGDCIGLVWWPGGADGPGAALYRQADVVLAYGGNQAIAEVRAQVPATTRFLPHGHKLGLALVGHAALDMQRGPAAARAAALDLVRWEQQGCYSPHVLYVERGAALAPRAFAQHLAAELANLAHRFPRRALSLEEAGGVAAWRDAAEWRAQAGQGELLGDAQAAWAVAFSDTAQPLAATPGQRCVLVCAVDALDDVAPLLEPHAAFLQSVALATTPEHLDRLAGLLGQAGVTRIAPLGGAAQPEAGWHHDGRFNLADLVRMVEIEQAAERACDRLAPYAQEGQP